MKVLSIQQPWASLVVLGLKKIETRPRNTKHRGELLIHASAGKNYQKLTDDDPLLKHYHLLFAHGKIDPINELPFGAIIGKVNLVDTCDTLTIKTFPHWGYGKESAILTDIEKAFGDYSENRFGWLLSDPVAFSNPIPAKGQLGLWNYSIEHLHESILQP